MLAHQFGTSGLLLPQWETSSTGFGWESYRLYATGRVCLAPQRLSALRRLGPQGQVRPC